MRKIHVHMTEIKVVDYPVELVCLGLGSCIAITLYDPDSKIGGLAHVMLPNDRGISHVKHPGKFANTAVKALLEKMLVKGANRESIQAKIFGGANMFSSFSSKKVAPVGDSNIKAVIEELQQYNIQLVAKDLGGNTGRSIVFDTTTGRVMMNTAKNTTETGF